MAGALGIGVGFGLQNIANNFVSGIIIPGVLRSELNFAICKKFKEHGIEIPFPQRDIQIRNSPVEVRVLNEDRPQ